MTLRGYDAISAAQKLKRPLGKYSEQSHRGFRMDLSVEEADELASLDQNLIFLELDIRRLTVEELLALSVALGGVLDKPFNELRDKYIQEGDDDRAEMFNVMAERWSELKTKSH